MLAKSSPYLGFLERGCFRKPSTSCSAAGHRKDRRNLTIAKFSVLFGLLESSRWGGRGSLSVQELRWYCRQSQSTRVDYNHCSDHMSRLHSASLVYEQRMSKYTRCLLQIFATASQARHGLTVTTTSSINELRLITSVLLFQPQQWGMLSCKVFGSLLLSIVSHE